MSIASISRIRNPINKFDLIGYTFLLILFSTIGIAAISLGNPKGVIGIVLGILSFIPFIIMEIVRKPTSISVMTDGLSLEFRLGKPILVPFEDVLWVTQPKQSRWGEGAMSIRGRFRYPLEYNACKAIRDAYLLKFGSQLDGDPRYP
jgi:hypothetical protein